MSDLIQQLEEAEARADRLRAAIAVAPCREVGHRWKFYGGRNAGCSEDCSCSVPVYRCERCGDCDYGDNEEAREKVAECRDAR